MKLSITINQIQHLSKLQITIDLSRFSLTCLVGKNGTGKTTLVKCFGSIKNADIFAKTSQVGIFRYNSSIAYKFDDDEYAFFYDRKIKELNSKEPIPANFRESVEVELPMPHGHRFSNFGNIGSADNEIRTSVMLQEYGEPLELIEFLNSIYSTNKFDALKEISYKKSLFYILPLKDDRYVREDHFSSGEYFLISLYRKIKGTASLIVIDEIDISLDAAAQTKLMSWLRRFCANEKVNIVFTTHSLAIMKTLQPFELYYIEDAGHETQIKLASYNYIKSILFGFFGFDRYILTEDLMLKKFLEFLIRKYCDDIFFSYRIIPVAGAQQVVQLMQANESKNFLSDGANVISILDGDQAGYRHARKPRVYCIPFDSVEKKLLVDFESGQWVLPNGVIPDYTGPKDFYNFLIREKVITDDKIFAYLCDSYAAETFEFASILRGFLNPSPIS